MLAADLHISEGLFQDESKHSQLLKKQTVDQPLRLETLRIRLELAYEGIDRYLDWRYQLTGGFAYSFGYLIRGMEKTSSYLGWPVPFIERLQPYRDVDAFHLHRDVMSHLYQWQDDELSLLFTEAGYHLLSPRRLTSQYDLGKRLSHLETEAARIVLELIGGFGASTQVTMTLTGGVLGGFAIHSLGRFQRTQASPMMLRVTQPFKKFGAALFKGFIRRLGQRGTTLFISTITSGVGVLAGSVISELILLNQERSMFRDETRRVLRKMAYDILDRIERVIIEGEVVDRVMPQSLNDHFRVIDLVP